MDEEEKKLITLNPDDYYDEQVFNRNFEYLEEKIDTGIADLEQNKAKLVNGKVPLSQLTIDTELSQDSQAPIGNRFLKVIIDKKADLNENGKIPEDQLPSYVDDVVEYDSVSDFPEEGEKGKIYVDTEKNETYRWSGTMYVKIGSTKEEYKAVSVTSDANVVTIPDEAKDYAAVSMIGGKTVKTRNLIRYPWLFSGTVENDDVKMVIYDNGTLDITAKRTTVADFRYTLIAVANGRIKLKPNTTYVANVFNELAEESTAIIFLELLPAATSGTRTRAINLINTSVEFTTTSEELYANVVIKVNKGNSAFNTLKFSPVIYEKTEAVDHFEPYFSGLHNAPVEKVVAYTNGNHLNYGKGYNNSANPYGFMDNALRCTSDELLAPISGFLNVSVSHPTKTMQFTIVELTDNRKVVKDSSWQPSNIVNNYALQSNTKYLRIVVRYSDNTTIALDDAIVFKVNTGVNETTISLSNLLDLPDYGCSAGDIYNYVDFENMVYHHKVGTVDMGTLTWAYSTTSNRFWTETPYIKHEPNYTFIANIINADYTTMADNMATSTDMSISVNGTARLIIKDLAKGTDATEFKTAMSGKILNYELTTEELIDIKPLITILPIEAGETIEFVNEHNLSVPNTVLYKEVL